MGASNPKGLSLITAVGVAGRAASFASHPLIHRVGLALCVLSALVALYYPAPVIGMSRM